MDCGLGFNFTNTSNIGLDDEFAEVGKQVLLSFVSVYSFVNINDTKMIFYRSHSSPTGQTHNFALQWL